MISSICSASEVSSRPIVGAIRWDAWSGGPVTEEVEKSLGPQKYHSRMPWFARVEGEGRVQIDGSPQAIMDQEIGYAASAGLDYWAFLLYPEKNAMSRALGGYLNSAERGKINFCVILHNSFSVPEAQWSNECRRAAALLKEPGYQTVLGGRPLVYAFDVRLNGEFPAQRFADFKEACESSGMRPYFVLMGWDPASDYRMASGWGFDAVSAYACAGDNATFTGLCRVSERSWQEAASAGVPYVPLVTTGWDKHPRKDNPVSWEKGQSYHTQKVFPATATPQEISSHLGDALAFVKTNRTVCAANAVILYAWNEHDEGGWLAPTWTPDGKPNTERLDAIRHILKPN